MLAFCFIMFTFVTCVQERVLQIRCGEDEVKLIGPEFEGRNKWQVVAVEGKG